MPRINVRSALAALFLTVSGIPVLVFWLWPHSAALQGQIDEVEERHLLLARHLAADLATYDEMVRATFASLAPLMAEGREVAFADAILRQHHFRHFCVVDLETGQVLAAHALNGAQVPPRMPPAQLERLTRLAADAPGRLSPVVVVGQEPMLFLAERRGDRLILAAITTARFQRVAHRISFGRGGHAAILDPSGRVLAHPRADWAAEARDLSALPPVARMVAGEADGGGVMSFRSPALEADVIAGYAAVAGTGWGVMVPQPLSELSARADHVFRSALVILVAGLGISAALAVAVASVWARRIGAVSKAARRIAEGEEGVRVQPSESSLVPSELADLSDDFNALSLEVEQSRAQLIDIADHDGLTGLLTRQAFVTEVLRRAETAEVPAKHTLFFVDVDEFKAVNDMWGHGVGDALLRLMARRLVEEAGRMDLVARQSGDEFLLLRPHTSVDDDARFARRIGTRLARPAEIDGARVAATCSIGACVQLLGKTAADAEMLIKCADEAMYRAKRDGPGRYAAYDAALAAHCRQRQGLLAGLRDALAEGAIDTVFQPIVSTGSGVICGFEALVRWRPDGAPLATAELIDLAEDTGLIGPLGRTVRAQACALARDLADAGVPVPVAVNVSRLELAQKNFVADLEAELARHRLAPSQIRIEVTETIFEDRRGSLRDVLKALSERGFPLALDDFGKGFSSHGLLTSYPFGIVKIDMSSVAPDLEDERAVAILRSLIELGRMLEMETVLEGVACDGAQALAESAGVDAVQGFRHAAPLERDAAFAAACRYAKRAPVQAAE